MTPNCRRVERTQTRRFRRNAPSGTHQNGSYAESRRAGAHHIRSYADLHAEWFASRYYYAELCRVVRIHNGSCAELRRVVCFTFMVTPSLAPSVTHGTS